MTAVTIASDSGLGSVRHDAAGPRLQGRARGNDGEVRSPRCQL